MVCRNGGATVFGRGRLKGSETVLYRIDVTDGDDDTYSIVLSTGYASGVQTIRGNIRIATGAPNASARR
jgi:hypothetical protein